MTAGAEQFAAGDALVPDVIAPGLKDSAARLDTLLLAGV